MLLGKLLDFQQRATVVSDPLSVDGNAFFVPSGVPSTMERQLVHYWTMSKSKGHRVRGWRLSEHHSVSEKWERAGATSSAVPAGRTRERWKQLGAAEELGG